MTNCKYTHQTLRSPKTRLISLLRLYHPQPGHDPKIGVTTGMVRRLNLHGGIRGEQEASHGDSHDRH
jgi:hypothetical protein